MFDPVSMGMFGVGAGLNVLGGFMAKDAANSAQGAMMSQIEMAQAASRAAAQQAASMFSPYQLYGSGALSFLQNRLLSGAERQMASTSQRNSLQAEIQRLGQETDWNSMPILTGAKASERRASMWQQMEMDRKQQLAAAQAKLTAFDKEQSALAPFQAAQDAQMDETRGRINNALDLVAQSSNFNLPQSLSQLRADMLNDPVFKFRQETGERAINRAAASRGNFLSGAAIASIGDFNNQLTADETDRYFNRLITGKNAQLKPQWVGWGIDRRESTGCEQPDGPLAIGPERRTRGRKRHHARERGQCDVKWASCTRYDADRTRKGASDAVHDGWIGADGRATRGVQPHVWDDE